MKYVKVKVKTNMLLSIIFTFFLLWTPALFKILAAPICYIKEILAWIGLKPKKEKPTVGY